MASRILLFVGILMMPGTAVHAQTPAPSDGLPTNRALVANSVENSTATERTRELIAEVVVASYPTLQSVDVDLEPLTSESDYFRTSFSAARFVFGAPMRYHVKVNADWFRRLAPDEAVRAILAHELAHVLAFSHGKRIHLLGLIGLMFPGKAARFERRTDLEAIARHYGEGLGMYRRWLYENIPPAKLREKRRNYFSPDEIDAILARIDDHPERLAYWFKHVPMSLDEINARP